MWNDMTEPVPRIIAGDSVGPVDATLVPRYAGEATFARLPRIDEVSHADVAVLGVPFDSGVSYRPGARFGPSHIRESSRLLRPYNPALQVSPFAAQQVADAGDLAVNPFSIEQAIGEIERGARDLMERARCVLMLGGDHTVALPMLRAMRCTARWQSSTSMPTSTPGTPISAPPIPMARHSGGPRRKASWTGPGACT
jgi:agmatinase